MDNTRSNGNASDSSNEQEPAQGTTLAYDYVCIFVYLGFAALPLWYLTPFLASHPMFLYNEGEDRAILLDNVAFNIIQWVIITAVLTAGGRLHARLHRGAPTALLTGLLVGTALAGSSCIPYALMHDTGRAIVAVGLLACVVVGTAVAASCARKGLPLRECAPRILGGLGLAALVALAVLLAATIAFETAHGYAWQLTSSGLEPVLSGKVPPAF